VDFFLQDSGLRNTNNQQRKVCNVPKVYAETCMIAAYNFMIVIIHFINIFITFLGTILHYIKVKVSA